jgi:hypothetical protein
MFFLHVVFPNCRLLLLLLQPRNFIKASWSAN